MGSNIKPTHNRLGSRWWDGLWPQEGQKETLREAAPKREKGIGNVIVRCATITGSGDVGNVISGWHALALVR